MDDHGLLIALNDRFQHHPILASAKLGTSVEDGVVVLSGYTAEGAIKAVAELVALEMPGVRAVANEIETAAEETWRYVDCQIAKKACDLLEWNSLVLRNLRIRVVHGCLSLFGAVENEERLETVSSILREFSGASELDNHLKVEAEAGDERSAASSAENLCA